MRYFRGHTVVLLAAVVFAITLAGCGLGPWLAYQMSPPKKVAAEYEPPEGKTILVFPDDMLNPVNYEPVKQIMAAEISKRLIKNKVAAMTVPYQHLVDLQSRTPNFSKLAISEVGEKLGAHIVLYVHIDKFSLKDNEANPLWHGQMETTVRMVDVRAKSVQEARLWPKDRPRGWPVKPVDIPTSETARTYDMRLARTLGERMAERIANLFCKHAAAQRPSRFASQGQRAYNVAG